MEYQLTFDDDPVLVRLRSAWDRAMMRLEPTMTSAQYSRFLAPLAPKRREDNVVFVGAPGQFLVSWIKKNFITRIQEALREELGEDIEVEIVLESNQRTMVSVQSIPVAPTVTDDKYSDRFTFENFVVGQSNRLAYAGAYSVAEEPGKKYNPLFIYGGSGLGKTHLLYAISNHLKKHHSDISVVYITAQQFVENFINALQHGRVDLFRRNLRSADIWLLDDVQFIVGKDKTQEELFHSFNQFQGAGKQIVFTSDCAPRDLYATDERLRSRFECGLVADIMPPDTETRTAIVLRKAEEEGVQLDHEICAYLAEQVPGNIRSLEGALTKLIARASLNEEKIDLELAEKIIQSDYPLFAPLKPNFDRIVEEVGSFFDVLRKDILGPSRKADIVHARHICVYFARKLTGDSWKRLGERFGNRDHTSMIHAYQKISELAAKDLETQTELRNLERKISPNS